MDSPRIPFQIIEGEFAIQRPEHEHHQSLSLAIPFGDDYNLFTWPGNLRSYREDYWDSSKNEVDESLVWSSHSFIRSICVASSNVLPVTPHPFIALVKWSYNYRPLHVTFLSPSASIL